MHHRYQRISQSLLGPGLGSRFFGLFFLVNFSLDSIEKLVFVSYVILEIFELRFQVLGIVIGYLVHNEMEVSGHFG